ncbi:MAG: OmpA family protein [Alphaproteobacteria bacterium]|nr:OmpA family protein [Alphaproteobacteria bacterium]
MSLAAPVALGQSATPSQQDITNALRPIPQALAGGHQGLPTPGTSPITQAPPPRQVTHTSLSSMPEAAPAPRPRSPAAAPVVSMPAPQLPGCMTAANEPMPAASLPSITFEFGSAQLRPESMATLNNLGKALKEDFPASNAFVIEGHTDAAGTFAYNQELSRQRAEAVKDYLVQQMGLKPDQLQVDGMGYCGLANPADPRGAENRRVVVVNKAA